MATTANANSFGREKESYFTLIEFQYVPLSMMQTAITDNLANVRGLSE